MANSAAGISRKKKKKLKLADERIEPGTSACAAALIATALKQTLQVAECTVFLRGKCKFGRRTEFSVCVCVYWMSWTVLYKVCGRLISAIAKASSYPLSIIM